MLRTVLQMDAVNGEHVISLTSISTWLDLGVSVMHSVHQSFRSGGVFLEKKEEYLREL